MNAEQIVELTADIESLILALNADPSYAPYILAEGEHDWHTNGQCGHCGGFEGAMEDADVPCDAAPCGMELTIGVDRDGSWSWQSGDNSFTGGAYGFAHWGVTTLTKYTDAAEAARDLVDQVLDLMGYDE